jgi:hypothetical protein
MAERIFISYRREDSRGYAGRLQGDLSRRYTSEAVFRDVEIPPGVDFAEHIRGLVDTCNVLLVIIGPSWLEARDREGRRRLDNPEDWVRIEIERALARQGVEVIPVLVDGAKLPPREELPEALLGLRRRNAFDLSDSRWDYDVEQLGKHLDTLLRGTSAIHERPTMPTPAPVAPDRTGRAVLAGGLLAVVTAFPANSFAQATADRPKPLATATAAVLGFVLEKAILFAIVGAVAALAVGLLSRRSRDPVVSCLIGLGAGALAGAAYAGAYAGLALKGNGSPGSSTAVGMIAAGLFLGWAFGSERRGSRVEAACAGLAGGLLAAGLVGIAHNSLDNESGHPFLTGLCIAVIVCAAGFVGLRTPQLLTVARTAPQAMNH